MRNCIILGSGRSGTSMLAGMFRGAGYYMGTSFYEPRHSNPKGFFEDREINRINEELLGPLLLDRPRFPLNRLFRHRPRKGQRWLAEVPVGTDISCSSDVAIRMREQTDQKPFCFKDPRFCYTLPAWRPFLQDAVFICVFREPARTAQSIMKECRRERYLKDLKMNYRRATAVWKLMYQHVLEEHRLEGEWVFIHYDQVLRGESIAVLESAIGTTLDRSFPDSRLKRSSSNGHITPDAAEIYKRLCNLAGYPRVCS